MKSKDGQYIVMCMHLEITVFLRTIIIGPVYRRVEYAVSLAESMTSVM